MKSETVALTIGEHPGPTRTTKIKWKTNGTAIRAADAMEMGITHENRKTMKAFETKDTTDN